MNSKRAKRIMKQARKNSRTGKTIISVEYDRLKKEHMTHTQNPKPKTTRRQLRVEAGISSASVRGRAKAWARRFAPKQKAIKF